MVKRILCIDGGGIRGVIVLQLLKIIEEEFKINLYDYFDMFAGTSTGAVITGLIAYNKMSAKKILTECYSYQNFKELFYQSYYEMFSSSLKLRTKYSDKNKVKFINNYFNNFIDNKTMYSTHKQVLIPAYDPCHKKPVFFRNYLDSPNYYLNDVINATSAAPTYYPAVKVRQYNSEDAHWCIDGGICVNNPSNIAYIDMKKIFPQEKIEVLSFGTGIARSCYNPCKDKDIGAIEWLVQVDLIDTILDGNQIMSHLSTEELTKENNDKYLRINKYLVLSSGLIDDPTEKNYLNMLKEGELWFEKSKEELKKFFNIE